MTNEKKNGSTDAAAKTADAEAAAKLTGDSIADEREVLETLTRILRREATEDTAVKLRTESRSTDEYGEAVVERSERLRS